jgi:hypothetical protein
MAYAPKTGISKYVHVQDTNTLIAYSQGELVPVARTDDIDILALFSVEISGQTPSIAWVTVTTAQISVEVDFKISAHSLPVLKYTLDSTGSKNIKVNGDKSQVLDLSNFSSQVKTEDTKAPDAPKIHSKNLDLYSWDRVTGGEAITVNDIVIIGTSSTFAEGPWFDHLPSGVSTRSAWLIPTGIKGITSRAQVEALPSHSRAQASVLVGNTKVTFTHTLRYIHSDPGTPDSPASLMDGKYSLILIDSFDNVSPPSEGFINVFASTGSRKGPHPEGPIVEVGNIKEMVNADNTGVFDKLMTAVSGHLKRDLVDSGNATGSDYATAYAQALAAVLQESTKIVLGRARAAAEVEGIHQKTQTEFAQTYIDARKGWASLPDSRSSAASGVEVMRAQIANFTADANNGYLAHLATLYALSADKVDTIPTASQLPQISTSDATGLSATIDKYKPIIPTAHTLEE